MSITIRCDGCGASFAAPDALIGKRVRCRSCEHVMLVSDPYERPSAPEPAPRPRRRRPRFDDEDDNRRFRPRRRRDNQPMTIALIVGGIVVGVLVLSLATFGMLRLVNRTEPAPVVTDNNTAPVAQANPAPAPQNNPAPNFGGGNGPPWGAIPPNFGAAPNQPRANPQMPPNAGGDAGQPVQLSNARVSGFGAHLEVDVDFRFSSGTAGSNLYLMVKPTRSFGLRDSIYECHLRSAVGRSQGTIVASGMTFGIENGPFEVWMEEGGPAPFMGGMARGQRRTVSNVIRVETKQFSLPGPMGRPGFPGRPHFPVGPRR
jgi:predicted Zn finger-like uncharacterized protein